MQTSITFFSETTVFVKTVAIKPKMFIILLWMSIFKVFRFQRKTLLFSYGTFFVIMLIIIFFHKICPGDFSGTIRPISKFFQEWLVYIWSLYPIEIFEKFTSGSELESIFWLFTTLFVHASSQKLSKILNWNFQGK